MRQIIAISSPIHVSTTGPVYLLTPPAVRHHRPRGWVARRLQTLLLAGLTMLSVIVLLRPVALPPATPHQAPLAAPRRAGMRMAVEQQRREQPASPQLRQPEASTDFPLHVCCLGERCLANAKQRHAVVTFIRNDRQLEQAKHLASSLWLTNPGVDLAVMLVRRELSPATTSAVMDLNATVFFVDPVASGQGRTWSWLKGEPSSWVKLRAFGLTQYDAVLLADPGTTLTGDASSLFRLPTEFVTLVPEQVGSGSSRRNSSAAGGAAAAGGGGTAAASLEHPQQQLAGPLREQPTSAVQGQAVFLRPCAATEAHLAWLLAQREGKGVALPAPALEADFLAWYFAPAAADLRLPFEVYVINVAGADDRLAHFEAVYNASDLRSKAVVQWAAVDGRSLDLPQIVSPKAMAEIEAAQLLGYRTKHYQLTRGSVGCYMSHMQLLKEVLVQPHEHALIFEDDALIEPNLVSRLVAARPFPVDWDIMLLGYYCYRCSPLLGDRRYIWVEGFFGTHAYLVHKRAVRKIFAYPRLMPVEQQIDALMSQMAQEGLLNIYALNEHPMLVDQNNKDFASSVQIPVKRGLWDDPYSRT